MTFRTLRVPGVRLGKLASDRRSGPSQVRVALLLAMGSTDRRPEMPEPRADAPSVGIHMVSKVLVQARARSIAMPEL
jgi:hypothetical protein